MLAPSQACEVDWPTLVNAVAAAANMGILLYTMSLARNATKQSRIAQRQSEIAQEQNEGSAEMDQVRLRAYVSLLNIETENPETMWWGTNNEIHISFLITNSGDTPALNVRVRRLLGWKDNGGNKMPPDIAAELPTVSEHGIGVVSAKQAVRHKVPFHWPLPEYGHLLQNGQVRVYVGMQIKWEDVFDRTHTISTYFYLDLSGPEAVWLLCYDGTILG